MSGVSGFLATWRVLALAAVLAVGMAVVGASPGIASVSSAAHHPPRPAGHAGPGSGLTLAQTPAGLRAAVRKTLGVPGVAAGGTLQKAKLTASDGTVNDNFGHSVAISGSTAVVGAYGKNSNTGAAYVFARSSTGTWSQKAKLTPSDGAAHDNFGFSVALSGLTAVVGATGHNSGTGAAYVFVRSSTGTWSQRAELTAADGTAGDKFGSSVALSGSTAVVSAPGSNSFTGAAYVFTGSGSTWAQQAKLTADDGAANDLFGSSVALSGSTAVVGAPGNQGTGAAYVFMGSGSAWAQQAKLTADDGASGDDFGNSVAIAKSTAVVGAPGNSSFAGAAYVFTGSGGTWAQRAKLTAADGASGDSFGSSVALSGSIAMVGAPSKNSLTGAAYMFTGSGSTWTQHAKLTASHGAANDFFGSSVALSGTTAVTGAYGESSFTGAAFVFVLPSQQAKLTAAVSGPDNNLGASVALSGSTAVVADPDTNSGRGVAFVFTRSGSTWTQQAKLTASDSAANDLFGSSLALSGSTVVVGAIGNNFSTGAAYVFTRSGSTWTQQAELTSSDGAVADNFGLSVALSGSIAVVGAIGNDSNTGAAYVFTRSGSTWTQRAKLTASDGGAEFGSSVALSGTTAGATAVVGEIGINGLGAAYVFTGTGSTWAQQAKLTSSDDANGDNFGSAVALSGTTAIVGAPGNNSLTGAAYVFTGAGSTWAQQAKLTASDGAAHDFFGSSVALSGSTAVVGAPDSDSHSGAAYVFARSGSAWAQQAKLTSSDIGPSGAFGASVAIVKSTAVVGAPGNQGTGAAYVFVNV